MNKSLLITTLCLAFALSACKSDATNQNGAASAGGNTQPTPAATTGTAQTETSSTSDPNAAVKFPFSDFPAVETTAKAGEYVLCPSFNWIKDGKPGTAMPAFGGQLDDSQIWDVVNYLRWLQQQTEATPAAAATPVP